jgi:group I intron endonuclease
MAYIYCIENKINQKKYVGKTIYSISLRFSQHKRESKLKRSELRPLYSAMNKYGIENFIVYQLEECSNEDASNREKY